MKQVILLFTTLACIVTFLFFLENKPVEDIKGEKDNVQKTLGYCETFERLAFDFARENKDIVLKKFDSSFTVLSNLKNGNLDYAIIGRKAYAYEIDSSIQETPLQDLGFTLVSKSKGFVEYDDLKNIKIHTYLNKEDVENFIDSENIVFHQDLETAIELGLDSTVLISWHDWDDSFQLLVPLKEGRKVEKFRTPTLYHRIVE